MCSFFCRIDYHLATQGEAQTARGATVYKADRFGEHAPLTIGYELCL